MAYSITKNTTLLTGASILQKVVSFVYFTLVARFLGASDTSQYFLALSFGTIFTVVADFGLTPVLTRELSRYPEKTKEYLNSMFWVKIFLGILSYGLIILTANLFNYHVATKQLISIAGLTVFFDSLNSVGYAYLRAQKNLLYESVAIFLSQFTTLAVGAIALFLKGPMILLVGAYTVPSFLNFFILTAFLKRKYNVIYDFNPKKEIIKMFLILAAPFALAGIISRLYSYTDTLIMSKMLTRMELGWWSVPYKIIFAFQFIPSALTVSVFPVISRAYLENKERVAQIYRQAWQYLLLISLPMAFGMFVLSSPVILKVYKQQYALSIYALQILGFALVFMFLSYINGAMLNATNRQKSQTAIVATAWILSIFLNLILIPRMGIYGAAWTALITNFISWGLGLYFIARFVPLEYEKMFGFFIKALNSAVIMAAVVYLINLEFGFYYAIPAGALVYFLSLYFFKVIDKQLIKDTFIKAGFLKTKN